MKEWKKQIHLRHLFTKEEDPASVNKSMNNIMDKLLEEKVVVGFTNEHDKRFREVEYLDIANMLLGKLWDALDAERTLVVLGS